MCHEFSVAYDRAPFYWDYRVEDLYTRNQMLGAVGGLAFLLWLLTAAIHMAVDVALNADGAGRGLAKPDTAAGFAPIANAAAGPAPPASSGGYSAENTAVQPSSGGYGSL